MTLERIANGDIQIAVHVDGPVDGRPVLLLHGFPDSSAVWVHQRRDLAAAGFRVIAPDTRGCGASDAPSDVSRYRTRELAGDVLAVAAHLGVTRCSVVGHDLGAAMAWGLAARLPDTFDRLVALSVGVPTGFWGMPLEQLQQWWYMLLFQTDVAEEWLRKDDWAGLRVATAGHPGIEECIAHLERPGGLAGALGWYRANITPQRWIEPVGAAAGLRVVVPSMGVWGSGDAFLGEAQMTASAAHVEGGWRYERLDGLGHWLQLEDPGSVSALLVDFLR